MAWQELAVLYLRTLGGSQEQGQVSEQPDEQEDHWGQLSVRNHHRFTSGQWGSQHVASLRSVSVVTGENERRWWRLKMAIPPQPLGHTSGSWDSRRGLPF